ncbi:MAG: methyltransferase, partial [Desulfobulbaceae bacterium]|nr:methyltransferase [Desulfobulbaceae bacterium]
MDVIEMGRGFCLDDKDWKDWVLPDGTPAQIPYYINVQKKGDDWFLYADDGTELGVQVKGCLYFEQTHFPLLDSDIESDDFSGLEDALAHTIWSGTPHPGAHLPLNAEGLAEMSEKARKLRESTDRAIVGLFGGNIFELPQWLYRMDNFLMYMGMYPEAVNRLLEKLCSIHLANLEKWMSAVGPYIDVICFGDDLGSQNSPLISPTMYKEVLKPHHKKMWNRAKELGDVKVMLHSCGSINLLLDDLIDAGL